MKVKMEIVFNLVKTERGRDCESCCFKESENCPESLCCIHKYSGNHFQIDEIVSAHKQCGWEEIALS